MLPARDAFRLTDMDYAETSSFIRRLETGKLEPDEFRALTRADWDDVQRFLIARRQDHLKRYMCALYLLRSQKGTGRVHTERTFSEDEILAELEDEGLF